MAIVAIAIAGRGSRPVPADQPAVPAVQEAAAASLPAVTPSARSDWPAAVADRNRSAAPREREEGTDGLMGRLPFGLANDTPYPPAERVNKFTIDDIRTGWSASDDAPPWSRRLGGLVNYRTDPYER